MGVSVSDDNNGIVDAAETYRTEGLSEDEASGEFGRVIFGGLKLANECDFDLNFDLLFGNTEQQNSLGHDLNVPVFGSSGGVTETGVQEFTQETMNKKVLGCLIENSNLGLEMDKMDWFVSESNLVAGREGRYTREEMGKTHMDDSWLALDSDRPVLLDLWPKSDFSMEVQRGF